MYCLNEQNVEHFNDTAHYLLLMHQNNRKTLHKKQLGKKKCKRLEAKKEKEKRKKGPNQTREAPSL